MRVAHVPAALPQPHTTTPDKLKAIVLSALLGAPFITAVLAVIKRGGPHFFFWLWLLVFTFQLFLLTIYPSVIAPIFNKCVASSHSQTDENKLTKTHQTKPNANRYEPLKDPELKAKIEALASKVKFPLTKVFVVDGSRRSAHSNAYMYGFHKNKRIVLFDTLLTQVGWRRLMFGKGPSIRSICCQRDRCSQIAQHNRLPNAGEGLGAVLDPGARAGPLRALTYFANVHRQQCTFLIHLFCRLGLTLGWVWWLAD